MTDDTIPEKGRNQQQPPPAGTGETNVPPALQAEERDQFQSRIAELEKAVEASRDQFLRKAAELENYKRRTEAELGLLVRNANEQLILSLLPVLDDLGRSLKAAPEAGEDDGFVKVHLKKGTDRIVGATIVARHAGELISEITLAMTHGLGLKQIGGTIHPYPTQADAIRKLGDQYNRTRLTPLVKSLLRRWLTWTR